MKRKFWNWIKDEDSGGRVLFLNGEISDETWYGDEVTPAAFRSELEEGEDDITVWINSPGGDVFAAAQIYNMEHSGGSTAAGTHQRQIRCAIFPSRNNES